MANPFKAIFSWIKNLFTRPGLNQFLQKYIEDATALVASLAMVHSNQEFHQWKDLAFAKARERYGEGKDNWIAILIAFGFEAYKAKLEGTGNTAKLDVGK